MNTLILPPPLGARLRKSSRNILKLIPLMFLAAFISACSDDDDDDNDGSIAGPGSESAELRVLHAVSDAPRVNVFVDGDEVLSGVDFRIGSAFLGLNSGTYDIRVDAIVPGGDLTIIDESPTLEADSRTTILAVGDVSEGTVSPLVVSNPTEPVGAGNARLQVTHASPEAPAVYLAVTSFEFPVDQAEFLGPLSFTESTEGIEVPAGDYQVRVAVGSPPFDDNDIVFDSGEIALPDGADLQAVAVTSTVPSQAAPSGSPISIVLLDGSGAADLFDVQTGADLRVVHNSVGAPAVNVIVDVVDTPADEALEIVTGLTYGNVAGYLEPAVAGVAYDVSVVLTASPSTEALSFTADLMPGMAYTAIANDVVANITELVLVDDNRRVATEAKLRLVHGSPSAGIVDIYVLPSSANLLPADTDPQIPNVAFGTETGFVSLAPDTYDIYVTGAGGDVPAISVIGLQLDASGIYTAIARDPEVPSDPLTLTALDDLAP